MNQRFLGTMFLLLTVIDVSAPETPLVVDTRKQLFSMIT